MTSYSFYDIDKEMLGAKNSFNRRRVTHLLDDALVKPATIITAGSGYGKTMIVLSYLSNFGAKMLWVRLQKLDNITTRFWKNFIDSIFLEDKELYSQFISLGFPNTMAAFDQFLHLFAQVVEQAGRTVLVFDDFVNIEDQQIHQFVERLTIAKLFNLSIIIILRNNNGFRLAKNNNKNVVALINEEDLRFSKDEIKDYFEAQGFALDDNIVENISTYTEGWALAIYLINMAFLKGDAKSQNPFLEAKDSIYQLLEKEFFSSCSYHLQHLLIKLSLLHNIPYGLFKEISDNSPSVAGEILNRSLLISFDPLSKEYRLHNILLDFLKEKQSLLGEWEVSEIYFTAARWYAQNGYEIEAINCYKKSNHLKEVFDIILAHKSRCSKNMAELFIAAIDDFPQDFVDENPIVYPVRAKFMLNNAKIKEGYEYLTEKRIIYENLLAAQPLNNSHVETLGEIYLILALISCAQRTYEFVELFKMSNQYLPNGSKIINYQTEFNGGNIVAFFQKSNAGEFEKIVNALCQIVPCATTVMNGSGVGIEHLAITEMSYNRGDLKNAEKSAYQAIYKSHPKKQYDIEIMAHFFLVRIAIARGQFNQVYTMIQALKSLANVAQSAICLAMVDVATSWFYAIIEETSQVSGWITQSKQANLQREEISPISMGVDVLVCSRCLLAKEQYDELLDYIEENKGLYGVGGFLIGLIEVEILSSICFLNLGDTAKALSSFEKAYELSCGNRLFMPFVEYGEHIKKMIIAARESNTTIPLKWLEDIYLKASAFAKHLARASLEYKTSIEKPKLIQLNKQENQILINLCSGLSIGQISESIDLSNSIVRSIVKNIYDKLGVNNTVDAIRAATALGLCEER